MADSQTCKSCDSPLEGVFCHVCGEKVISPEDKSVKKWLSELFSSIWMLDGKLLKTLKYLIFRPGQLASDYVAGKRKPYVRLLNLFLIANIIYFLSPTFSIFQNSLKNLQSNMPYAEMVNYAVDLKLESKGLDIQEYMELYDQKTSEISKLILIVLAPMMGLVILGLFRKQGLYLSDGFGLALQYWAFFILIFIILLPKVDGLVGVFFDYRFFSGETFVTVLSLVITGIYLFFQMKPWKAEKPWIFLLKIFSLVVAFLPILFVYRIILFWTTWLVL